MDSGQVDPGSGADSFSTAIMDPRVQALLGMAGGLAQAAMPSRLPVPTGAAIGMGAQGLSQGLASSMQLQNQAMALRLSQARMPAQLALANAYSGAIAPPNSAPTPFGVPPSSSPSNPGVARGPVAPVAGAPFGVPNTGAPGMAPSGGAMPYTTAAREWQLGMISQAIGDSASAVQHFKTAQEMSGGTGYEGTASGGSTPVPGGPADPAVLQRNSAATAMGTVPADLLKQGKMLTGNGIATVPGAAGANYSLAEGTAAGTAYGSGTNDMVKVQLPDPANPGALRDVWVTKNQAAILAQNGGGGAPTQGQSGNAMSAEDFVARMNRNPSNTPNPGSTALGPADVTNRPWQQFITSQHPELQGVSGQQLVQLKNDPTLASQFTLWNARQNAATLTASNAPVNASTLALAHYLGAKGAADVLNAPAGTPLTSIPSIVQSGALRLLPNGKPINPDLLGATAGGIAGKYKLLYGSVPVNLGASASPQQGGQVGIPSLPNMTPEQGAVAKGYGDRATQIIQQAGAADALAAKLPILANAAEGFRPGASGATKLRAGQLLSDTIQTAGGTPPAWLKDGVTGGEVMNKEGMSIATSIVSSLGDKAGFVLRLIAQNNPNVNLSNGGYNALLQVLQQEVQRKQDLRTYQENWVNDPAHNGSIKGMEAQFAKDFPPEAYASRVIPFPAPKSPSAAIPNVIYNTPRGPMKWAGTGWVPPGQ